LVSTLIFLNVNAKCAHSRPYGLHWNLAGIQSLINPYVVLTTTKIHTWG
jgi:hypothetical protein